MHGGQDERGCGMKERGKGEKGYTRTTDHDLRQQGWWGYADGNRGERSLDKVDDSPTGP